MERATKVVERDCKHAEKKAEEVARQEKCKEKKEAKEVACMAKVVERDCKRTENEATL